MKVKLMLLAIFLIAASPIFAQGTATPAGGANPWAPVAAVIGMAFASGVCGLAQGRAVAGAAEAMARNPGASAAIRFALILGLVLIESLALYTLVIVFLKT
jgi:F-type H+-transporting ATPase subunit c